MKSEEFPLKRRKEALAVERIPVTVTVSRETGQIVGVECSNVTGETFRKVCQELMKIGKEEKNDSLGMADTGFCGG